MGPQLRWLKTGNMPAMMQNAQSLNWVVCVPLAVEVYGCWGPVAQTILSRLAARLAIRSNCCKSQVTSVLYGRSYGEMCGHGN